MLPRYTLLLLCLNAHFGATAQPTRDMDVAQPSDQNDLVAPNGLLRKRGRGGQSRRKTVSSSDDDSIYIPGGPESEDEVNPDDSVTRAGSPPLAYNVLRAQQGRKDNAWDDDSEKEAARDNRPPPRRKSQSSHPPTKQNPPSWSEEDEEAVGPPLRRKQKQSRPPTNPDILRGTPSGGTARLAASMRRMSVHDNDHGREARSRNAVPNPRGADRPLYPQTSYRTRPHISSAYGTPGLAPSSSSQWDPPQPEPVGRSGYGPGGYSAPRTHQQAPPQDYYNHRRRPTMPHHPASQGWVIIQIEGPNFVSQVDAETAIKWTVRTLRDTAHDYFEKNYQYHVSIDAELLIEGELLWDNKKTLKWYGARAGSRIVIRHRPKMEGITTIYLDWDGERIPVDIPDDRLSMTVAGFRKLFRFAYKSNDDSAYVLSIGEDWFTNPEMTLPKEKLKDKSVIKLVPNERYGRAMKTDRGPMNLRSPPAPSAQPPTTTSNGPGSPVDTQKKGKGRREGKTQSKSGTASSGGVQKQPATIAVLWESPVSPTRKGKEKVRNVKELTLTPNELEQPNGLSDFRGKLKNAFGSLYSLENHLYIVVAGVNGGWERKELVGTGATLKSLGFADKTKIVMTPPVSSGEESSSASSA